MIQSSKPLIENEEINAAISVLKSGNLFDKNIIKKFEQKLSLFFDNSYVVLVNSGSSALHLALLALGLKENDEIILPAYVCSALLNAINYINAKPVIVDINEHTFNICPNAIKKNITKKTKLIITPHMFGYPCNMDEILKFNIPVLEDCAMSTGTHYKNKLTGTIGTCAVTSFYATKYLTAINGGAFITQNKILADTIRDLINYDKQENYKTRYNYGINAVNATIGIVQLKKLKKFIKQRKKIAKIYFEMFKNTDFILPHIEKDMEHVFYRFLIKHKNAEYYKKLLAENKIEISNPVYKPLNQYLKLPDKNFVNTNKVYKQVISLPIYPLLTGEEIHRIQNISKALYLFRD